MKPLIRHKSAILLILIITFAESFAVSYVFDALSNFCANYRHKLEFINSQQPPKPSNLSQATNVKVIEGPNGTKEYYYEVKQSVNVKAEASGEHLDYSEYVRHIILWKTLENMFELIRDIYREMAETLLFLFCALSIGERFQMLFSPVRRYTQKH